MTLTTIATALPEPSPTGWGVAGKRIVEELTRMALVHDLNQGTLLRSDFPIDLNIPVLQAIRGLDLMPIHPHVRGISNVGYGFCEDQLAMRHYALNAARHWDIVAVGSSWAHDHMLLALDGIDKAPDVVTAIQGVDQDLFCPSDTIKPDPAWFTVFSGGKWEFRKSQDVVIRAMAVMIERHKDVRLVASWWNPWDASAQTMQDSTLVKLARTGHGATADMEYTAYQNGIPEDRVQFVGKTPHIEMPAIMSACNVGLFPNRCEAGTNLVMMEAMACDMPVIAVCQHGHADVTRQLEGEVRLPTNKFQVSRNGMPVAEWFEPDLDATIAALEYAYQNRDLQQHNRTWVKRFTWAECAKTLLEACQL